MVSIQLKVLTSAPSSVQSVRGAELSPSLPVLGSLLGSGFQARLSCL